MKPLYLVTGANGFTGSFVTRQLLSNGHRVRALVRSEAAGRELEKLGCEVAIGELRDPASLEKAVQGTDCIIHIAALFRQAGLPSQHFYDVNVEGTRALLDLGIKHGVTRFVHCSTGGVYGHIENPPADENTPFNPGDVYQESKLEGERLVFKYFEGGKISGVVIRPGMIYGPGDERTGKLFRMVAKRAFFYVGPGNADVHFVDVRDLARAFESAALRTDVSGEAFNIAGRKALPLHKFVGLVASMLNVAPPWLHLPVKPLQVAGSICEAICTPFGINPPLYRRRVDFFTKTRNFSCKKAEEILGYRPEQELEGELVDILNSYIEMGLIKAPRLAAPSRIERNLDGAIEGWDPGAERTYGWTQDQALGNVTHSLLKTEFPTSLERINSTLQKNGSWSGTLRHRRKDGSALEVFSHWKLHEKAAGRVIETNYERYDGDSGRGTEVGSRGVMAYLCGLGQVDWSWIPLLNCEGAMRATTDQL